jgi:hypothetical protein
LGNSEGQEESNDGAQLIVRIGRFDGSALIVATRFVEASLKLLKASDKRAKTLEEQFNGVDPQAEVERIQGILVGLSQTQPMTTEYVLTVPQEQVPFPMHNSKLYKHAAQ